MSSTTSNIFLLLLVFSTRSGNLKAKTQTTGEQFDSVKIEFPPPFVASDDPLVPAGHLRPFGLQKAAKGPLKEYNEVLRPPDFWEKHVSQNLPLVFRGGIKESPALRKWTDDRLKEDYGDLDVLTEHKKENRTHGFTGRTLFADFIERYEKDNLYVVTVLPDPMRQDVQALPCLLCGTFRDFLHETNFWMSSGGTRSVIHYDADHNLHCIVAGRKDFMMIDQKFSDDFKLTKPAQFGSGYSPVNPDVIDLNLYPGIANVEWTYASLGPGDCIYIPSGYIHQVRAYGRSISVTTLFTTSTDHTFQPTGCEDQTFDYTPLSAVNVTWTYNKGDKFVAMGYMNVEKFRELFLAHVREQPNGRMNAMKFDRFVEEEFPLDEVDAQVLGRDNVEIFKKVLDAARKGYITASDVQRFSKETLKEVLVRCETPHGPAENEGANENAQRREDQNLGHQEL